MGGSVAPYPLPLGGGEVLRGTIGVEIDQQFALLGGLIVATEGGQDRSELEAFRHPGAGDGEQQFEDPHELAQVAPPSVEAQYSEP